MVASLSQLQRFGLVMAVPLTNHADPTQELLHVSRQQTCGLCHLLLQSVFKDRSVFRHQAC
jgi:hypothetical protein